MENMVEKRFNYKGIKCEIKLISYEFGTIATSIESMWRCGYVIFPKEWKDKIDNADKEDRINVHGGITLYDEENENEMRIGFDCKHGMDTIQYWTLERVEEETNKLAKQIISIGSEDSENDE